MTILIQSLDLEIMFEHCKEAEPNEACGILVGKVRDLDGMIEKTVLRVYLCTNELNSPIEYKIKADEQFKIFKEIADTDLELLGFYHSHPTTSSTPSIIDMQRANYVGYSYIILSLHSPETSSWILEKKDISKKSHSI